MHVFLQFIGASMLTIGTIIATMLVVGSKKNLNFLEHWEVKFWIFFCTAFIGAGFVLMYY